MSEPIACGAFYWCVKVAPDLSKDGEIYVYADYVTNYPAGSIAFMRRRQEGGDHINLILGPGQWRAVYVASVWDGAPVAVEH